jgi:hypothetical protein
MMHTKTRRYPPATFKGPDQNYVLRLAPQIALCKVTHKENIFDKADRDHFLAFLNDCK